MNAATQQSFLVIQVLVNEQKDLKTFRAVSVKKKPIDNAGVSLSIMKAVRILGSNIHMLVVVKL